MSYDAESYRELIALAESAAEGDDVPLPQDRAPPAIHPATAGTKRIVLWSKWHPARRYLGLPEALRTATDAARNAAAAYRRVLRGAPPAPTSPKSRPRV